MSLDKEVHLGTGNQLVTDGDHPHMMKMTGVGSEIWVHADYGHDDFGNGTYYAPYKTLNKAWDQLTESRNVIQLMPTSTHYELTATLTFQPWEVFIQGQGDPDMAMVSAIKTNGTVSPLFEIKPGAVGETLRQAHFSNMLIDHSVASQIGLQVDNLNSDGKILIWIQNVAWEGNSGNAIDVDHNTNGAASSVKMFMKGCGQYMEGNINWNVGGYALGEYGGGDRINIDGMKLEGKLTVVGDTDTTPEIQIWRCQIKHEHAFVFTTTTTAIMSCIGSFSKTGMTFDNADTSDIESGSATDTYIGTA